MAFGIATVLGWDLEAVQQVGSDLVKHEQDLRGCFTDFQGSSDLAHAWSGSAADAQHTAAETLAKDLYTLTDMVGLLGNQIGRKAGELVEYQNAIKKARSQALEAGCEVADDGTVTLAPGTARMNRGISDEVRQIGTGYQTTIVQNLKLAAAADIDLAKALAAAENTICQHATPAVVDAAVHYQPGPLLHPAPDPFLSDVPVGGTAPSPGDPTWANYWQALTLFEQQKLMSSWNKLGKDFNPYSTVQGGPLPPWATQFNTSHQNACSIGPDGRPVGAGYGYFGGGTIMGPDGKPWPIVNPYYSDGKYVYSADGGATRSDGGINQLDGRDGGWRTVQTYAQVNQFGTVGNGTKLIVAGEIATGQDIEVNPTDPGAVTIGPDGLPVLKEGGGGEQPSVIADKPWWDAKSPDKEPVITPRGAPVPDTPFNNGEAALGADVLPLQTGQGVLAAHELGSHAEREWQVQYQVNDDGRVRAVVHTYTSGPNENGGTNVGGFSNGFPNGQHGTTSELPINTRDNPYTTPTLSPGTPADDHYLGDPSRHGELIPGQTPIQEKLNR